DFQVEITRRPAAHAGPALATQADALTLGHALGDAHVQVAGVAVGVLYSQAAMPAVERLFQGNLQPMRAVLSREAAIEIPAAEVEVETARTAAPGPAAAEHGFEEVAEAAEVAASRRSAEAAAMGLPARRWTKLLPGPGA